MNVAPIRTVVGSEAEKPRIVHVVEELGELTRREMRDGGHAASRPARIEEHGAVLEDDHAKARARSVAALALELEDDLDWREDGRLRRLLRPRATRDNCEDGQRKDPLADAGHQVKDTRFLRDSVSDSASA